MSAAAVRVLVVAEPRGHWLQRAPVVADCSVLAALLFNEPAGDEAAGLLVGKALHAPTLLPYEMASVAGKKRRAGAAAADMAAALEDFE